MGNWAELMKNVSEDQIRDLVPIPYWKKAVVEGMNHFDLQTFLSECRRYGSEAGLRENLDLSTATDQ